MCRVLLSGLIRIEDEFLHRQTAVRLILGHKDLRMAAKYQHLSPAFDSDTVKLVDGAYAESTKIPNVASSGSIVTVALPEGNSKAAKFQLNH